MKWFEVQIGLYVEAETEDEAISRLSPVLVEADKLDPESDSQTEVVAVWEVGGAPKRAEGSHGTR